MNGVRMLQSQLGQLCLCLNARGNGIKLTDETAFLISNSVLTAAANWYMYVLNSQRFVAYPFWLGAFFAQAFFLVGFVFLIVTVKKRDL